jgi:hypothetical protein
MSKADIMPVRTDYPNPAAYEAALQDWQSRHTLPTEKIIPPSGDITALQVRKSPGSYTSTPPSPKAILPES